MANFLGYECPKCTDADSIEVVASVWVRLGEDGTDSDAPGNGDHEFEPSSRAICQECGFEGKLYEFEPLKPAPCLLETLQQALTALNTAPRFAVPALDTDSYKIAALCEAAIREARGA